MKQKGIAPIVIVILIAILAVGGYLIYKLPRTSVTPSTPQGAPAPSPSPDASREPDGSTETTNWKMYTNSRFFFQMKYPSQIQPKEETTEDDVFMLSFQDTNSNPKGILVRVRQSDLASTVEELKSFITGHAIAKLVYEKSYAINGLTGKRLRYEIGSPDFTGKGFDDYIVVANNQYSYTLQSLYDSTGNEQLFDQILSTFKFTN